MGCELRKQGQVAMTETNGLCLSSACLLCPVLTASFSHCPPPFPTLFFPKQHYLNPHSEMWFHRLGMSGIQSCGGETCEPSEIYFFERDYIKQFTWQSFGSDDVKL